MVLGTAFWMFFLMVKKDEGGTTFELVNKGKFKI